jgi:hypothetical protein
MNENDNKPEDGESTEASTPELQAEAQAEAEASVENAAPVETAPAVEPEKQAAAPLGEEAPQLMFDSPPEPVSAPVQEAEAAPELEAPMEVEAVQAEAEPIGDTPAETETQPEVSSDTPVPETDAPDEDVSEVVAVALAGAAAAAAVVETPAPESEAEPEPKALTVYEYRFLRVKQNAWDSVEPAILNAGAAAAAEAGGQLFGVWIGQIGLSSNQGVVVTVWPDLEVAKRNGSSAIAGIDGIATSETMYMEGTTRPTDPTPPEGPGMFAHRVFEVRRDDAERFVELSNEAWPQFEEVFGARVFALWREVGHERANERLILLTRYADYAAWENSRFWRPEPDPNAADALQRFRERREITLDTVVYTTRLAVSSES